MFFLRALSQRPSGKKRIKTGYIQIASCHVKEYFCNTIYFFLKIPSHVWPFWFVWIVTTYNEKKLHLKQDKQGTSNI